MKMLSPDELRELREDIATLGLPDDRQDELIRLIDNIIISIIDQEFGWSAVQISLLHGQIMLFLVSTLAAESLIPVYSAKLTPMMKM